MQILTTAQELDALPRPLVFVPTMGALHQGHASLVRLGAALARDQRAPGGCVVSIFVNPTQFNDPSDFARYPRTLAADSELCRLSGAAAVFAPEPEAVYPGGKPTAVPDLPPVAALPRLEDAHRPGHFEGVCQVVCRLFEMVRPSVAVFGEKDWQQLQVVRALAASENLGVEIVGGPTVREHDGLALSSRNRFLGPEDRRRGLAIFRALRGAARCDTPQRAQAAMREILAAESINPDYAAVRESCSLSPWSKSAPPDPGACRALIAARVGPVRLLDNWPWPAAPDTR